MTSLNTMIAQPPPAFGALAAEGRDRLHIFRDGFIFTSPWVCTARTTRYPAVLLLSLDGITPFVLDADGLQEWERINSRPARSLPGLERLLERMERAGQSGSSDWVLRHQEFHALIYNLSGRPKLIRQITALHVAIEPYMRIWFDYVDKPLSAREEHQKLIDALRSGDARHAEAVMQEHIIETASMLADYASPGRP